MSLYRTLNRAGIRMKHIGIKLDLPVHLYPVLSLEGNGKPGLGFLE